MLIDWLRRLVAGLDVFDSVGHKRGGSVPTLETAGVVGCSVAGPAHDRNEDAWSGRTVGDSAFAVAVADGLGSERFAHEGSQIAAETAVGSLGDAVAEAETVTDPSVAGAVETAFVDARARIRDRAVERDAPTDAFGTTLLVAAGDRSGVVGAAVGDGGVVAAAGEEYFPLVRRDRAEYANVTTPLTSERWRDSYRIDSSDSATALALFTDGLDNFVWARGERTRPSEAFFEQVFPPVYRADRPDDVETDLCAFLDDDRFRAVSKDDKTLVIGLVPTVERDADTPDRAREHPRVTDGA
jgi:hypothetical protein